MKLLLIYNPHAGQGRAGKHLSQVESLFHTKGIETELQLTKRFGHGSEIVRDADLSQYDGVVAAGGDGTVFEVVNGWANNPGDKKPAIGIMPVGTGNAFAIDLNLKTNDIEHAVDIIAADNRRKIDVGKFRTNEKDYYYLNIIGLGFVADVTATARKLKIFGNVAYLLGVLYKTIFLKSHTLSIEIDGQKLERKNIFVEVSNSTYTSNFLMAPNAQIDDGYLDVTLLEKCTRRKLLKSLPTVFTGEHIHLDIVETFKAKKIKIETDPPKVLTPDGELFGSTPLEIECLHNAVEVFAE